MANLTVGVARLGRFVLSGYHGFVNNEYSGHPKLLSKLDISAPASVIASRFVLCDPENGGLGSQLEFRANVLPSPAKVLERAYPKYQNPNLWNKFILPYILDAIQDSNCLSASDFHQLKEIVSEGREYSNLVLQLAMIIGDFYRAAMQIDKMQMPKNGKDLKLSEGIFDGNINLNLRLNRTGKLEVQAKPLCKKKTSSPPVQCTIMDFLPSSYEEAKHLFYLGCLDALSKFKLLLPWEEKELQELVLGETPFSRTALQVALLVNDAYSAFSKLSRSELDEIGSEEPYLLAERLLDNLESSNCNSADLNLSINSGLLELRATPHNEEASVVVDVVPNDPVLKKPNMKRSVLGFILDGMGNTEFFERQTPTLRALLLST